MLRPSQQDSLTLAKYTRAHVLTRRRKQELFLYTQLQCVGGFYSIPNTLDLWLTLRKSYVFTDSEHARKVCSNEEAGYVYSRIANVSENAKRVSANLIEALDLLTLCLLVYLQPTVEVLEKRVAALEGGSAAVATASGQSAIFQTVLCLTHSGDNIVSSVNLYGGTYSMFKTLLPRMGISVRWVSDDNPESYRALIDEKTKMVLVETVGNPRINIPDLRAIAEIAHENLVPLVVSNAVHILAASWLRRILTIVSHRLTTHLVLEATGVLSSSTVPTLPCITVKCRKASSGRSR